MNYDTLITNGTIFDGENNPSFMGTIGIRDGKVEYIGSNKPGMEAKQVIDASGKLIMPGFVDIHTHYDAEIILSPGIKESIRHGVTTIITGSCSVSFVNGETEDTADIFTRVESIPREFVLPALKKFKTWNNAKSYVKFLQEQPIAPNVACLLGHSDVRIASMGLGRSVDENEKPSKQEFETMKRLLNEALDEGFIGMSVMTNPWDKVDGDRFRSKRLPSTYASWKEYRMLFRLLRKRDAVLQAAPNLTTKYDAVFFLIASSGFFLRKRLRTTLITLMDLKADRMLAPVARFAARFFNRYFNANFKWQALPNPFLVFADGMDFIVFEEFPAGELALHLTDEFDRKKLLSDPAYRKKFKQDYNKKWSGGKVWHRDFGDAIVIAAPDQALVGKSIRDIAIERKEEEVGVFLDLIIEHGNKLRWKTLIGNHRPEQLFKNMIDSNSLIGFSDAGAHLRNMAFYNYPLFMLKIALEDNDLSLEKAVWKLSGEPAQWLGLDTGTLQKGKQADVVIIDPDQLKQQNLDEYHEADIKEFGMSRLVNRHDGVVSAVYINGELVYSENKIHEKVGKQPLGRFLKSKKTILSS